MGGMTDAQTPTVPTPEQDRERLKQLIQDLAVVHGRVTLSSGKEADYYVDLRRVTLHHEDAPLIGRVMLRLLEENGIAFDAVGGLTMGADPVACAALAGGEIGQHRLGMFDLGQHALRQRQQVSPGLGQAQSAPLFLPDGDAMALLELAHGVADGRLRQV